MDLVILGFDDLVPIIDIKFGGEEKMRDSGLSDQADQIYTVIPQIKVMNYKFFFSNLDYYLYKFIKAKIEDLKKNVADHDLASFKNNLEKKALAFYREKDGKSFLTIAIEKSFFDIAVYLLENFPLLSKINDCVSILF